jgi:hypothetical protein
MPNSLSTKLMMVQKILEIGRPAIEAAMACTASLPANRSKQVQYVIPLAMTNGAKRPGTWVKGQSGNPAGRPALPAEFREQIRSHTPAAIRVLVDALKDPDARVRVAAAKELLDRGHGKPATVADVTLRQEPVDLARSHLQALLEHVAEDRRLVVAEAAPDAQQDKAQHITTAGGPRLGVFEGH